MLQWSCVAGQSTAGEKQGNEFPTKPSVKRGAAAASTSPLAKVLANNILPMIRHKDIPSSTGGLTNRADKEGEAAVEAQPSSCSVAKWREPGASGLPNKQCKHLMAWSFTCSWDFKVRFTEELVSKACLRPSTTHSLIGSAPVV